ncbi:acyl-CoA dehydrogenase family protein [Leptolyngbya sp. NIES-2104]|uniref:acyl-CoA dehydrogenase family protein n=1 Tax=Leptolyngbya sp. NIES-2104 TaxID=1552121 RepID=UPI0006EC835E|nr:acyl-CoA dehydrogenase family protein [Leptolyngbya sp. NIES-2104]GAP95779.1 acyl-CoA dehydrogenase family protein [Leptolyngbya sp. NIES-2104]
MESSTLLETADIYLWDEIAPIANQLDEDADLLRLALKGLGDRNLLALRVPRTYNGADLDNHLFHSFQEQVARFSGALAFLQTQHQSAGAILSKSQNEDLKQAYLPRMGTGKAFVGIGFSHLRRHDNPPLKAIETKDGYQLHGHIPWITGFGFFEMVLAAALLPNGQAVYGMLPFSNTHQNSGGSIQFSEPMELAAMSSTNTVTAEVVEWDLERSEVAFVTDAGAIFKSDRTNILNHSFFALGCAQAGLDIVSHVQEVKPYLSIAPAYETLLEELKLCRHFIYSAQDESFEERLRLRVWAIDLAVRCAHAAVVVSSGAANSKRHPAQRVYREALVFSVAGQTTAVLEGTLDRIAATSRRYR